MKSKTFFNEEVGKWRRSRKALNIIRADTRMRELTHEYRKNVGGHIFNAGT